MSGKVLFMRLMVFFDLPVVTAADKKQYRLFKKFLRKDGYIQLQESVYTKLVINPHAVDYALVRLDANKPSKGLVHALSVTEAAFASMKEIVGNAPDDGELQNTESLVVL